MSEDIFKEILGMALASEFSEFDNMTEHKFSLKHRLAMKRVFARFARNARKSERKNDVKIAQIGNHRTEIGLKKRLIVAVIIVFLALFLVGWIWIAESLYKLDSGSLKGYTVNETMLSQIKAENRIPTLQRLFYSKQICLEFVSTFAFCYTDCLYYTECFDSCYHCVINFDNSVSISHILNNFNRILSLFSDYTKYFLF